VVFFNIPQVSKQAS